MMGKEVPLHYPLIIDDERAGHEFEMLVSTQKERVGDTIWPDVVICIEPVSGGEINLLIHADDIPALIEALREARKEVLEE